jgi:CheY-like chemotaxis protein
MSPLPLPRVLIVEDEITIAMRIAGLLEDMGCAPVRPATLVATALPLALHEQLDAALLDVYLIDRSVEPVAEALAERGVPFAFVTAHSRERLPPALRTRPHIEKPFTDRQLRTIAAFLLNPV